MHKQAKEMLKEFIKEFRVYRESFAFMPVYENESEDKLYALRECLISTNSLQDKSFPKEELGHFIQDKVSDGLQEKYKKSSDDEKYNELTELLTDNEIDKIIQTIEQDISELPYNYKVYFSLGLADKTFQGISIQIDDGLFLKGIDRATLPTEGFNSIKPSLALAYSSGIASIKDGNSLTIELSIKGYVDMFAMTPVLEKAIKKIKTFTALMMIFNILRIDFYKYISFYFQKSVFVFDGESKFIRTVELEHDLSESLHRLSLHDFAFKSNGLLLLGKSTPPTNKEIFEGKFEFIKNYFAFIAKSSKSKKEKEYAKRLENILSWYLLGISATNKSVGFVSLVFALESLFTVAPTDKGELISSGLAGRCAYFISNDFNEREGIITDIGKIYRLRSNIAHDGVQITTKEELELFAKLLSLLQFSLNKEIKNIKV